MVSLLARMAKRLLSTTNVSILVFSLLLLGIPFFYSYAPSYPSPPSGSVISHTTIVTYSGLPTNIVSINVSSSDPQSSITSLELHFAANQSFVDVQIYQLSGIPPSVGTLPSGVNIVLIAFFSAQSLVEYNISSVTINFKVPLGLLSDIGLSPSSANFVTLEYSSSSGTWSQLPTLVTGSDSNFLYLATAARNFSLFAVSANPSGQNVGPSPTPKSTSSLSGTDIAIISEVFVVIILGISANVIRKRFTQKKQ
jgi:PGF-pre-PGF domain-containing protein